MEEEEEPSLFTYTQTPTVNLFLLPTLTHPQSTFFLTYCQTPTVNSDIIFSMMKQVALWKKKNLLFLPVLTQTPTVNLLLNLLSDTHSQPSSSTYTHTPTVNLLLNLLSDTHDQPSSSTYTHTPTVNRLNPLSDTHSQPSS